MPWGFRRSLRIAGPLRLNLSKSGLGLSLGVPGLHVGKGPRGAYLRAGLPGTGIYYRTSLGARPAHTRAPAKRELESEWMKAVKALLAGDAGACLTILDRVRPGQGPALNIEVGDDVVVTIAPDTCGIAVLRAEALDRLGRVDEALAIVEQAGSDQSCHVGRVVAAELREQHSGTSSPS
jgi:hypothetical protein